MAMDTSSKWKSKIKQEYEDKHLTHKCFQCSARYASSGVLVQHMKEEHSSFVERAASRIAFSADRVAAIGKPIQLDTDRYQNAIATCPFCQHDCQTRKKLMRHLELEHKDKDDNDHEEEPKVKVIRIDENNKHKLLEQLSHSRGVTGSFVTPDASNSKMVQNLLKVIGTSNNTLANGNGKSDCKNSSKLQYKCFWCDASFRKRGKLMDHIDTLHKHNKQQNQVEAELLSMDDPNKAPHARQMPTPRNTPMSQLDLPPYLLGLPYSPASSAHSLPRRSPHIESKPTTNISRCSFTLAGSLSSKPKQEVQEDTPPNRCKFFLGKKDNPLANTKVNPIERHVRDPSQRRFSLPNIFEGASTPSPYSFPYRMLPPGTMAAMQHSYLMNIRPPMMSATQFYAPRMPMMMPSSDYLVNHAHPMLEHHTQNPQAQFFARMNAMAQMSPLARPKAPDSPLDLTKSYNA